MRRAEHSDSAFHAFSEFFHVLGLRVKGSKAQPPASRHVLQGVDVHVRQRRGGAQSHPEQSGQATPRHSPVVGIQLTQPAQGRTPGRQAVVPHQAVFGAVGCSALQPVCAGRGSHNTQANNDQTVSVGLRSALSALAHMLNDIQPRFLPNQIQPMLQAVVFADAYVETPAQSRLRPARPTFARTRPAGRQWLGIRGTDRPGGVLYHGTTPRSVLNAITLRRAFIHALGTLAGRLPADWMAFIDNTAGEAAFVNGMLAALQHDGLEATVRQSRVQGKRGRRRIPWGPLPCI